MAAKPPEHEHHPSSFPPATSFSSSSILIHQSSTIDFSPPLIAMVVVAAAAFLFITYSRLISRHIFPPFLRLYRHHRRRARRFLPSSDLASPPAPYQSSSDGFYLYSPCPYGLDDSIIKNIPLTKLKFIELLDEDGFHFHDCAVCLVDFQEGECIRTLPHCCHPFHVDCIDMWLRSHATCPLCRAGVFLSPPPDDSHSHPHPHVQLSPVMAARVRPSFDQGILLESMFLEHLQEGNNSEEIQEIFSPESERRAIQSERSSNNRRELDSLLKRSYSFGFERRGSYPSVSEERLVMEPATTPYHHHRQRRSFFWRKRPSSSTPFRSMAKSRVFSFRRTMKSQSQSQSQSPAFFRRKGYISMWESSESLRYGSSRRMKASPGPFSSSRMRLGDPEALISPERYNRHRR